MKLEIPKKAKEAAVVKKIQIN
ncbi:hypothetical protein G9U52_13115 [Paenibacillus sp. S3N08]|uniref:Uncharacterized protein n=1 Tax=Paenibacillus agricola TaxID=2716264 RepID=A0ABX0J5S1_9BACL|nr:hypothetical protein [Paenibacillus agricola]